jgi:hypothetical protein
MDKKIYHIYDKENQCVSPCLSEEEFSNTWKELTEDSYEYEELDVSYSKQEEASY